MAINLTEETLLTFEQARRRLPGQPHLSTLHRWRQRGVRGVRLETCRIGGARYTSQEALQRFSAAITALETPTDAPPFSRSRERRVTQAEHELERHLGRGRVVKSNKPAKQSPGARTQKGHTNTRGRRS